MADEVHLRNRLSPQEKKQYSYAKDRRNAYGERGANSRHAIRENKLYVKRSRRRAEDSTLREALSIDDSEALAAVENRLRSQPAGQRRFYKSPDAPLRNVVACKLAGRARHREVAAENPQVTFLIPAASSGLVVGGRTEGWRLNPADVAPGWTAGGSSGRTNYTIQMRLTHIPTGIAVQGETAKANFTRSRATAARRALYAMLFSELERLVARHLRVPRRFEAGMTP